MKRWTTIGLIVTGLVPVLGLLKSPPEFMLLIYTAFAAALLWRRQFKAWVTDFRIKPWLKLWIVMVVAGVVAEVLAWGGNYAARAEEPALLHPQLIPDVILAVGFYSGWAVAWIVALRWWPFSLVEAFVTAGVFGVCFEQMGSVLKRIALALLVNPALAALTGIFVFVVYGSIVGLAYLPVADKLTKRNTKPTWAKYPVVFVLMFVLMVVGSDLAGMAATALHLMPPKQPIGTHPFW